MAWLPDGLAHAVDLIGFCIGSLLLCHHAWCLGPISVAFGRKLTSHLTGHLTGNLTGLTGFCPDHANNHLLKSCHHGCLAVGALEFWFLCK